MATPSWSLCIATLNRHAVLKRALECILCQTVPAKEIVIVDASENWIEGRRMAEALLMDYSGPVLIYENSKIRSSAMQRNLGLKRCSGDVVFMIDDDSFMYPDCAEEILKVYERDTHRLVAGVTTVFAQRPPDLLSGPGSDRKASGRVMRQSWRSAIVETSFGRWLRSRVLFQDMNTLFLKYDEPRDRSLPPNFQGLDLRPMSFLPGCAMTVRREVAVAEPFDTSLRYYAAFEDLDATYRYGRHGHLLRARAARLHHYEVAGGRLKRKKIIVFQLMNMLVFLKRHAADPQLWLPAYRRMLLQRLFGEWLKDLLAGRLSFPQAAGVVMAMRNWRLLWAQPTETLDAWYPDFQKKLLDDLV